MYYTEYNKIYCKYNSCENNNSTIQQGKYRTETTEDQQFIVGNTGMSYTFFDNNFFLLIS